MTCTLTKDKITKDFLDKRAIGPSNKILNKHLFDQMNSQYSKMLMEEFKLDKYEKVFEIEGDNSTTKMKAVPNDKLFRSIDELMYPSYLLKKDQDVIDAASQVESIGSLLKNKFKEVYRVIDDVQMEIGGSVEYAKIADLKTGEVRYFKFMDGEQATEIDKSKYNKITTQEDFEKLDQEGIDFFVKNYEESNYDMLNSIHKNPLLSKEEKRDLQGKFLEDQRIEEDLKQRTSKRIEEANKKFYSKLHGLDVYLDELQSPEVDNINTVEAKIAKMEEAFNVKMVIDTEFEGSGMLLAANHPITQANGKPVIVINPENAFADTVFHEFGHLYIDMLGGINDPEVKAAIELLKGSELWDVVAERYPELNQEELGKEVLATALGIEGNKIFKDQTQESIWQRIKQAFLQIIDRLFSNGRASRGVNAIESLASQMLNNQLKTNSTENFNSLINQNRKLYVDPDKDPKTEADKLLKYLRKTYSLKEEEHNYVNQETNTVYEKSTTTLAKNLTIGKNDYSKKGFYDIDLDKEYTLTKDNWKVLLHESKLPWSLDKALSEFFDGDLETSLRITNNDEKKYWYSFYNELDDNPLTANIDDEIETHLDAINARAQELEQSKHISTAMGNDVHQVLEDYINARQDNKPYTFPSTIEDTDNNDMFNTVKGIVDRGLREGSTFYTEQILFNDTSKTPGTADLIEITKDGKFRIYDFKTTKSFKYRGERKNDYLMYIRPGYLNQLIIYATMLEDYGLEAADDHLNIISMEVDNSEYELEGDSKVIKITDVINKNIDPSTKSFNNHYNYAKDKITDYIMSPEILSELNIDDRATRANKLALKIQRALKDYRKLTNLKTGKFKIDSIKDNSEIYKLEEEIETLIGENNTLIMYKYIDNMRKALHNVYEETMSEDQILSPSYVQNINYLIQASSFIDRVGRFISEETSDFNIENKDKEELLKLLEETKDAVNKVQRVHDLNSKLLAIKTLSKNSNFMEGLRTEHHEVEGRKKKLKGKELQDYIYKNLKKEKKLINKKERDYWDKLLSNGYIDIRHLEYLLADPGMNKSQFVQVVKNILDKVDNDIRIDLDKSIPEIVKWHDELGFETTGDPSKVWAGMFNEARYKDLDGNIVKYNHSSLISETTSVYREAFMKHYYKLDYLKRELNKAYRKDNKKKIEELEEFIEKQETKRNDELAAFRKDPNAIKQVPNPAFQKLSKEKQEALKYIHKKLEDSDERLYAEPTKKLVFTLADDTKLHNLPKMRKTHYEAMYDAKGTYDRFKSGIKEMWNPAADEDDMNMSSEEQGVHDENLKTKNTDIVGDPSYDVPVYYRNQLEDPTLQSFDIPTLLAMNEETTIAYQHHKLVEADLYMITSALKNTNALKTDSLVSKEIEDKINGKLAKSLQSSNNLTLKSVQASINNRFYKRTYSGTYSKWNYRLIKGLENIGKGTSALLLAGNFRSATMTGIQGSIYRFIEGVAGENFTLKDAQIGSKKAWGDIAAIMKDTQEQFPKSKTNLLIRRFGLETQYKALVNKFIQDNFVTKNLDQATLFAVTSIAETMVTANLMYTLLNNIKVMDRDGNYIDANGNSVKKENAMSLDEAYEVVDGKLELNKYVVFTERNLNSEFNHKLKGEKTVASTEISRYIRSIYADLYGQYNQDMKSVAEMNVYGKLAMSMRKWIPRGYHRRFRGVGSLMSGYTFEDLRKEENAHVRFYSQDQKKFQEGYYTTGARYAMSLIKHLKQVEGATIASSYKYINNTLTTHERANLKRLLSEAAVIILSYASALMLRALAQSLGDDDDRSNDKIYYALYIMERIKIETATFINPFELLDNLKNPAAAVNTLTRIRRLFNDLVLFTIDDSGEIDWNIDNRYKRGLRKGDLKLERSFQNLIPFSKNWGQLKGILELDSNETIKDSYEYLSRPL